MSRRQAAKLSGRRIAASFNNGGTHDAPPSPWSAPKARQAGSVHPVHALAINYAESDPLGAARALAAGLQTQVRAGAVAAVAVVVDALSEQDSEFGAAVINRLRVTHPPAPAETP